MRLTSGPQLHRLLVDRGELALLDAREPRDFSADHLLWAVCVPLSRLEEKVAVLVPRRTTPVLWCDAGEGLAEQAASAMSALGWTDVAVLEGGIAAWPGVRYSGVNVPSKAFGEWIEHVEGTPHVSARDLAARVARGEPIAILDSRPETEFNRMSIPGGIDCPGAELVYRVHDIVTDPSITIVVNCAGRTRSIIGAQALRNAGFANPVYALKDGTMGWDLAGLSLAHGQTAAAAMPSSHGLAHALDAAAVLQARFDLHLLDQYELATWTADQSRTTFVLDVRTAEEFAAGHRPGAQHAPGGQLVQATDEYVGVRGARLVLTDTDGVRASITASWLVQMNAHEVAVFVDSPDRLTKTGSTAGELAVTTGSAPGDAVPKPYDSPDRAVALEKMREYLEWEVELLDRIGQDDTVAFRSFPRR